MTAGPYLRQRFSQPFRSHPSDQKEKKKGGGRGARQLSGSFARGPALTVGSSEPGSSRILQRNSPGISPEIFPFLQGSSVLFSPASVLPLGVQVTNLYLFRFVPLVRLPPTASIWTATPPGHRASKPPAAPLAESTDGSGFQ